MEPPLLVMPITRSCDFSDSTEARVTPEWIVMKSTPSCACRSTTFMKFSKVMSMSDFFWFTMSTATS